MMMFFAGYTTIAAIVSSHPRQWPHQAEISDGCHVCRQTRSERSKTVMGSSTFGFRNGTPNVHLFSLILTCSHTLSHAQT